MNNYSIPTCHFPSTVLFIDDSRDFLLNFVLQLDEGLAYRIYDSPYPALERIKQSQPELESLSKRCATEYTEAVNCPLTNHTVNVNLAAIHAEIYNPLRFSEISVVVVDYAMPGMNGIDFCRSIEDSHIKKILLTGQADESVAIQAFNEGLIHRYIKKNDPKAAQLITESIEQLQRQYFLDMSAMVVKLLSVNSPSCLQDKIFSEFFMDLIKEKGIVEYYLADSSGSFLFLDSDARLSFLLMKSQADLECYHDLGLSKGAPAAVLDPVQSGEKIPCYWQTGASQKDWDESATLLLPASRLVSEQSYYYSYVEGPLLFDIRQDKVLSYNRYLDAVDAEELMIA